VTENRSLRERMALAGEALIALEERAEREAQVIRSLRESLATLTAQHLALQERCTAAAAQASPTSTSPRSPAGGPGYAPHPHTLSHTPRVFHNSFNSLPSPRSRSSNPASLYSPSSAPGDGGLTPQLHHFISPSTSPRRRLGYSSTTHTLSISPAGASASLASFDSLPIRCRAGSCQCNAFTPQPSASWICVCGHMSLKHAGGPP